MNNFNTLTILFQAVCLAPVAFLMFGILCYLPSVFVHAALESIVALLASRRGTSAFTGE